MFERSLTSDVVYASTTASGSGLLDPSQHFTLLAQQIWRLAIGFSSLLDAESNSVCTYDFCLHILTVSPFLSFFFFLNRGRRRQTLLARLVD